MLPMIPLTIHTSSIDLNYCSSARLSEDKELMWRGFAPRRSVQSDHLCCRFQPILYDNSVYLFRHTSTPDFFEQTPYTGFEPASLLQPTVFKTAPSPPGHTANIAVWWNCYIRNCFCHHFVQFHTDFLPLTARFTPVVS